MARSPASAVDGVPDGPAGTPSTRGVFGRGAYGCVVALVLTLGPAQAQTEAGGPGEALRLPAAAETSDQPAQQPPPASIETSIGDPGGVRAAFAARGVTYSLTYIGETLANLSGGLRRGAIYSGRLDAQFDLDLDRIAGWSGATLHANVYQIHGHGLSRYYLANLLTTSGIEALSSTRLFELWIEQKLLSDRVAIRAGQLAADTEFIVSQFAGLFVNATFGWPAITAANLPNGGPAYPLATPGIRVRMGPFEGFTVSGAVFNGAPAGFGPGDPQLSNPDGLEFRGRDPALLIGELAFAGNLIGRDPALPGTIKVGGWRHLGRFDDQRRAIPVAGASSLLADPAGSGVPRALRGNSGVYAVLDQILYRTPGTEDGGLGAFVRVSASPEDRNLIGFYVDGGFAFKGLLPGRPDDTFGVAGAYARISDSARRFDADLRFFNPDTFQPIRSSEAALEVTYQAQIVPGWTVQPDLQYIFRPGGNVINPRSATGTIARDAVVVGLRTAIRY